MKKTARHLLMLLSMLLLYPPVSVYAFTGSVPADGGTYYLYNVGKQAFVYGDNDWGTRVSLTQQGGIPVTLVSSGEAGRYYISTSPTYPDLFLGYDGYVDKASTDADNYTSWLFTAVEGQTNVYTLKATKNDKYWLVGRASDNKTTRVTSAPTNNYGYWMLVTRAALVADLADATTDNPKDATKFIVNPNFGVKTSGAGWTETPKIGGHTNYQCAERWNISSFDVAQTLTGMPNGIYKMNIQGFYRVGGSADNATEAAAARTAGTEALNAKYYINDVEGTLMSIFDNTRCLANNSTYNASTAYDVSGTSYYVPNDLARASSCFYAGDYQNEELTVTVTDGTIRLGIRKTIANANDWAVFDNITLTYCGSVQDLSGQLEQAKARWHTKYDAIVNQALDHSAFDAVLAAADTYCTTEDALTKYDDTVWQAVCDLLKNGTTATGQFDITTLIENPTFDSGTGGWNVNASLGYSGYGVAEVWNQADATVSQRLASMPAGTYTFKAQAFYRPGSWRTSSANHRLGVNEMAAQLFLGTTTRDVCHICDYSRFQSAHPSDDVGGVGFGSVPNSMQGGAAAFDLGLYWNVLNATTAADGDITLGLTITGGQADNWLLFDNFRLYYGATSVAVDLSSAMPTEDTQASTVTTGISLVAGQQTSICLPFDLNATQTASLFTSAYELAGVQQAGGTLTGQLLPVGSLKAGKAYIVVPSTTQTLTASDVLVRVAQPDSIPVLWEGAATVGSYDGYTFSVNLSDELSGTVSYQPVDYANVSFCVNAENWRARRFLNEFTYAADGSVTSKIRAYNYAYPTPVDRPHSVCIPVPQNSSALTVTVSTHSDMSEAETFTFAAGTTRCELPNLIPQHTYYYKVEGGGAVLTQGQFDLQGRLRMVQTDYGFNIRDLGGWLTLDGNRVRYGKVFRGGELNFGHTLSAADIAELRRIGIGAEIDWRRADEVDDTTPTTSVLSSDAGDYLYLNHDYANMRYDYAVNKEHYRQAFTFMLTKLREGKAVYFHCRIGADRTGQFALLLDGLSGLTFDQLCKEYELTSFSEAGTREWDGTGAQDIKTNLDYIQTLPGTTLQQQFFYYMNHEVGIATEDLLSFIDIMVDGESSIKSQSLAFSHTDGEYLQSLGDIAAVCAAGSTLASGATARLSDGTTATDVTMAIDGIAVSFSGAALTGGKTYTLTIPAGAVVTNGAANAEALTLTFHTPLVFDGVYYLYSPFADRFLSTGATYGTTAVVDRYGMPFYWTVNREGRGTIRFIDNNKYLYGPNWIYTDGAADDCIWFETDAADVANYAGYQLRDIQHTTGQYLYVYYRTGSTNNYSCAANGTIGDNCDTAGQSVWQFYTRAQRDAVVTGYTTDNIQRVITASGIEATVTTLASILSSSRYQAIDRSTAARTTSFGSGAGSWTYTETSTYSGYPNYGTRENCEYARLYEATGTYTLTVPAASVPAGIYKVELGAFERHASESTDRQRWNDGDANPSTSYLAANGEQVQFVSWYQMNQNAEAAGESASYSNQSLSQQAPFVAAGYADISLYVYLDGQTDLQLAIAIPSRISSRYVVFNNLRLTHYVPNVDISENATTAPATYPYANVTLTRTLSADHWNTFCLPFDMSAEQITATFGSGTMITEYESEDTENRTVTMKVATCIEAGVPYLIKPAKTTTNPTISGVIVKHTTGLERGNQYKFIGVIQQTEIAAPAEGDETWNYFLNTSGQMVKPSATGNLKGMRAYFNIPAASAGYVKVFINDIETGIMTIREEPLMMDKDKVYNLAGQRVDKSQLKRGIYIINGETVWVK